MSLKVEIVFVIWSEESWSLLIQEKLPVCQSSDIYIWDLVPLWPQVSTQGEIFPVRYTEFY